MNKYLFPNDIAECLDMLAQAGGRGRIIAGGTDLVLAAERGSVEPDVLVDITRIPGLQAIDQRDGRIWLGAAVTHAQCAASPLLRSKAIALAEACSSVGSPQIRQVGTVAGNVVNAQPAADAAIALTALGATAEIVSASGTRSEAVEELYAGVGRSKIDPTREILARVSFPTPGAGEATAFMRFSPRAAMALPILNGAAWVAVRDGKVTGVRMALGPVATKPFRPLQAEASLIGKAANDAAAIEAAALAASQEATPRDSLLRGSAAYRLELVRVLVRRMLKAALERAA